MRPLRWIALFIGFVACLAPMAHVLELPNKLQIGGSLWLAVQQHLYNGWGPLIGAPTEIGGLLVSLILRIGKRGHARCALLFGVAAVAYGGMLLCFFLLNAPVNDALIQWTPETLPADWGSYRLRWETGHAVAGVFALLGLAATVSGTVIGERSRREGR